MIIHACSKHFFNNSRINDLKLKLKGLLKDWSGPSITSKQQKNKSLPQNLQSCMFLRQKNNNTLNVTSPAKIFRLGIVDE